MGFDRKHGRASSRRGTHAIRCAAAAGVAVSLLGACSTNRTGTTAESPRTGVSVHFPVTLKDDEGVSVKIASPPRRIVTFGQSLTEVVFALGAGNRLVGVCCQFDNFPPAALKLPHVEGEGQQPNAEKVLSLRPQLMLNAFPGASVWANPLRKQNVPVFTTLAASFQDALHDMQTIGRLIGADQAARSLTSRMSSQAGAVSTRVASERSVSCFLDLGGLYTPGPHDFLFDLLRRAGCDPISATAKTSFPQWSKEQLVADDPDVFLFTSDSGTTIQALQKDPVLKRLRAVRTGHAVSVNGDLVSRPGPRLVQGLLDLARALHPSVFS